MSLLDVAGTGLFSHSADFFHALGMALKFLGGSFIILIAAVFSFIGVILYSIYSGIQTSSVLNGAKTLIHFTAYAIGITIALGVALVLGMFFSLTAGKLLFVTVLIAFAVSFIVRETFLFLVLKRFGKYLMYFTALQYIKEKVYNNGEQENHP